MRRWKHFLSAALPLALMAGCAPAAPPPSPSGAPAPAATTVKLAAVQRVVTGQPTLVTLDPHASLGSNARRYGMFEALVGQKADGTIEPQLASSWQLEGQTTWRFTLVPGRVFHDGTPVTAEDIRWSFARAIDPANKLAVGASRVPTVASVQVDGAAIVITTKGPDPILLKRVNQLAILPKAYFERVGPTEFALKAIGSGPYKLKAYVPNDRLELTAVPDHPAKPTISEVVIRNIPDTTARLAGIRTGELDLAVGIPYDQIESLKSAGLKLVTITAGRSNGAFMDSVVDGPTGNKLVRQAINYAIDKNLMVKQIFQGYTVPDQGQILQPETFGFNPDIKPYPYDPAKAKQLLAQAGYPTGFKMRSDVYLNSAESQSSWLFIQQQLKEVGIEVELNTYTDSAKHLDYFYGRTQRGATIASLLNNSPYMDADAALVWFRGTEQGENGLGARHYANAEFDKLYDQFSVEMNENRRRDLIRQAVAVMHEDPPYIFLTQAVTTWMVSPKLEGVVGRTDLDPAFEFMRKLE